ncbi:MAG: SUMF1/EgtB/PvdO family nonheme iron enzyme [Rhodospirillaceae bacterium]|nr:SUMF1/EgtB/PvdO family nonheme iron enzyme [Rhodospirillaceae bacterium]
MRSVMIALIASLVGGAVSAQTPNQPSQVRPPEDPTVFRDCAECPEMKIVPAGSFTMGAPDSLLSEIKWKEDIERRRLTWETPRVKVTFAKPFALGVFEITRDQFEAFVKATNRKIDPGCTVWKGEWIRSKDQGWNNNELDQRGDHPVVCVDWADAQAYADWLTQITGRAYTLPSNAQWEYAHRAGTTSRYFWGEDPEAICAYGNTADATLAAKHAGRPSNACDDGYLYTAPVGMKKPNPWGFYDMTGNAWEWIDGCFAENNKDTPPDGSPGTAGDCTNVPLRGGAYGTGPMFLRSSSRGGPDPKTNARQGWIGFRVVAAAEKSK